jgi:hypothetical protein
MNELIGLSNGDKSEIGLQNRNRHGLIGLCAKFGLDTSILKFLPEDVLLGFVIDPAQTDWS